MKENRLRRHKAGDALATAVETVSQDGKRSGPKKLAGSAMICVNDYEELQKKQDSLVKVLFNGYELVLGQKLISNGSHPDLSKGTEVEVVFFDSRNAVLICSQSLWVTVVTEHSRRVRADPFNFEGFEGSQRDNSSVFDFPMELSAYQKMLRDSAREHFVKSR